MLFRSIAALSIGLSLATFSGCKDPRNEKKVYPIQGTIFVDGKPAEALQIQLHDAAGTDAKQPTFPQGTTDASGAIKVSTYAEGDGAPEGEYTLTITWQEFNALSRSYSGSDKLNKKYSDPKTSSVQLSVGASKPNDLGKLELSSKR